MPSTWNTVSFIGFSLYCICKDCFVIFLFNFIFVNITPPSRASLQTLQRPLIWKGPKDGTKVKGTKEVEGTPPEPTLRWDLLGVLRGRHCHNATKSVSLRRDPGSSGQGPLWSFPFPGAQKQKDQGEKLTVSCVSTWVRQAWPGRSPSASEPPCGLMHCLAVYDSSVGGACVSWCHLVRFGVMEKMHRRVIIVTSVQGSKEGSFTFFQ